jgi:surface protein
MSWLFEDAISFNGDISGWDTSNVTDMSGMFESAASLNGAIARNSLACESSWTFSGESPSLVGLLIDSFESIAVYC